MTSVNEITNEDPARIIAKLHSLSASLADDNNHEARKECLQLSKKLTSQLERPENVAVDMAFSVLLPLSLSFSYCRDVHH
jgi:hypothetical protein